MNDVPLADSQKPQPAQVGQGFAGQTSTASDIGSTGGGQVKFSSKKRPGRGALIGLLFLLLAIVPVSIYFVTQLGVSTFDLRQRAAYAPTPTAPSGLNTIPAPAGGACPGGGYFCACPYGYTCTGMGAYVSTMPSSASSPNPSQCYQNQATGCVKIAGTPGIVPGGEGAPCTGLDRGACGGGGCSEGWQRLCSQGKLSICVKADACAPAQQPGGSCVGKVRFSGGEPGHGGFVGCNGSQNCFCTQSGVSTGQTYTSGDVVCYPDSQNDSCGAPGVNGPGPTQPVAIGPTTPPYSQGSYTPGYSYGQSSYGPGPTPTFPPGVTPTATPTLPPGVTPSATPTLTPTPTPVPPAACNYPCVYNSDCQGGMYCYQGYCRNPACSESTTCLCQPTPTPTQPQIAQVACNYDCTYNSDCQNDMVCYQNHCRNPYCVTASNCVCSSAPQPTTPPQYAQGPTPVPPYQPQPSIPVSGVGPSILGIATIAGGALLLLLGLVL